MGLCSIFYAEHRTGLTKRTKYDFAGMTKPLVVNQVRDRHLIGNVASQLKTVHILGTLPFARAFIVEQGTPRAPMLDK